jgi:hypothetical protein
LKYLFISLSIIEYYRVHHQHHVERIDRLSLGVIRAHPTAMSPEHSLLKAIPGLSPVTARLDLTTQVLRHSIFEDETGPNDFPELAKRIKLQETIDRRGKARNEGWIRGREFYRLAS